MACAALDQEVLGEAQRKSRFQDVVDQQDLAVAHIVDDVAHHAHPPAGLRAGAVARQGEEIHRPVGAGPAQRADQVGGEHEAALEHRHHQRVGRQLGGELRRHLIDAAGDLGGGEADRDGWTAGHRQTHHSTIGTMLVVPSGGSSSGRLKLSRPPGATGPSTRE